MGILLVFLCFGFIAAGVIAYRRSRSTLKWILISGATIAVLFLGLLIALAYGLGHSRFESGEALASVKWLDSRASDISYYRANDFSGYLAYEFQINGHDFSALAKERGWQVAPVAERCTVMRYLFFLPETDARRQAPLYVESSGGLFYESRAPNGGGITVFYDTLSSRAYVVQSSR